MSLKEMDNENATKPRGNVYTIHSTQIHTNKYTEHIPRKSTTASMREKGIDKYANAQTTMCAECTSNDVLLDEFSKWREQEIFTSRTFLRQFVLDYKRVKQSSQREVIIQSALCEVACEQNSHSLKTVVVKIYRTVVSA